MKIFYNAAANECYNILEGYWPSYLELTESVWMVPGTFTPESFMAHENEPLRGG